MPRSTADVTAVAASYCEDVLDGRIAAGKWTRLACERAWRDWCDERPEWPYYWDAAEAARAVQFIELLSHVEGSWSTTTITLEPWQVFVVAMVFGWRRKSDGGRRFSTVYLEVARKNAKSTLAAAIALYCLCCEHEPGAQVKCAATTGKQARIVFDIAKKMVQRSPELREQFQLEVLAHRIVAHRTAGHIEPINSKASTQDGLNPHAYVLDELHAHKTRDLFDVLKSARGARRNPLGWYVTTAGYDTHGVCFEQRTLLTKVLQGLVEMDHYFGIIYALDRSEEEGAANDDEYSEDAWRKANPNLGVSVSVAEMRTYAAEAKASPDSHAEYLTKRCNVWTGAKAGWLNMNYWRKGDAPVNLAALVGQPCYGGIDLAATQDITAFVLVWHVEGRYKWWGRYYVPEQVVSRATAAPYTVWRDRGLLIATPGNVTDYAWIERDVRAALDRFDVQAIGYDRWNATDVSTRLAEDGAPLIEVTQGPRTYNTPMRELERAVLAGQIDHGGDPVLAWMASNVVVRRDVNGNLAPDRSDRASKIDGVVAGLMGMSVMLAGRGGDEGTEVPDDYEVTVA